MEEKMKIRYVFGFCILLLLVGCGDDEDYMKQASNDLSTLEYQEYEITQVFKEYDGYRIFYLDENSKVNEKLIRAYYIRKGGARISSDLKFLEDSTLEKYGFKTPYSGLINIYKDVEEGKSNYVKILIITFKQSDMDGGIVKHGVWDLKEEYAEIHLKRNSKISGGTEKFGTIKQPIYQERYEIT